MQGWGCNIVQHGSACVCTRLAEEKWPTSSVEIMLRRPEGNGYEADSDGVGHVNSRRMEWEYM